ncbi:hypothetical protein DTO166G4_3818 [Paecilomyces variotii]|nr:hypothetical protein DTO166G4_3818 [Paecilomyces variotii]KAJ9241483.1 hypothetical protein DTO166G5_1104 [Paecilomyces variotii]KAJ9264239.1 hypothetical protein DTO195F2_2399 [Paecilomyces variotii]KAJ9352491.1 hypothetical protein DTO027B9_5730 [Paecilomyces variotii]
MPPKRVAIIGGGCAGISSLWALRDSGHEVHLFESSDKLGGRLKTLPFEESGRRIDVDTGPVFFNAHASPNFDSLIDCLGLHTSEGRLSFGFSQGSRIFQWGSSLLRDVLFHPGTLCSLETWQTIFDVVRFKYLAADVLDNEVEDLGFLPSVRDYLAKEGYSHSFCESYLVPLLSELWRTNSAKCLSSLPIKPLIRFLHDHGILSTSGRTPEWQTIQGGAEKLIKAMTRTIPTDRLHLKARVANVEPADMTAGYTLHTSDSQSSDFDHIIYAIDGEEILKICGSLLDVQEINIISELRTSKTVGVLHSDTSLMPNDSQRWSACNYISNPYSKPKSSQPQACLTFWANNIQNIPYSKFGDVFITLNPFTPPHPRLVQGIWEYTSPELSASALNAERELPTIQNTKGLSYCGSWTGCNFYEETVTNGLKVAVEHLGAELPFQLVDHQAARGSASGCFSSLKNMAVRMILRLLGFYIWMGGILLRLLGLISVVRFTSERSSNAKSWKAV